MHLELTLQLTLSRLKIPSCTDVLKVYDIFHALQNLTIKFYNVNNFDAFINIEIREYERNVSFTKRVSLSAYLGNFKKTFQSTNMTGLPLGKQVGEKNPRFDAKNHFATKKTNPPP